MRKFFENLPYILGALVIAGGIVWLISNLVDARPAQRAEIQATLDEMSQSKDWQHHFESPKLTNNQSYEARFMAFDEKVGKYHVVAVSKDRFGNRYVSLYLSDGTAYLKNGMCEHFMSGVSCLALKGDEWTDVFVRSVKFARARGAQV